jgi:hypothetical protein
MKHSVKEQWIKALRSRKYKQGKQFLRKGDYFCALGVLCDLYLKAYNKEWSRTVIDNIYSCDDDARDLSIKVEKWAGLNQTPGIYWGPSKQKRFVGIDKLNDMYDNLSFEQLADLIEEHL